eukprot:IDg20201t1
MAPNLGSCIMPAEKKKKKRVEKPKLPRQLSSNPFSSGKIGLGQSFNFQEYQSPRKPKS